MITRYRNKAFKWLGLSFFLVILVPVLVEMRTFGLPDVVVAVGGILLGTAALVFYMRGNIAIAKAKGHDSSPVAAIIIMASICTGGLFFAMPLILFFGLNDKTKRDQRLRAREPEPTRRNPPAKLPPLRNDSPV